MKGWKSRLKWASVVLRLTLAMQLCAASIGFFLHKSPTSSSEMSSSWLGPPLLNFTSWVFSSAFVLLAASIVIGFYRRNSLLVSAVLLVVLSWLHLYYDPVYNLSEAVLLLLLSVLGNLWIEDQMVLPGYGSLPFVAEIATFGAILDIIQPAPLRGRHLCLTRLS